MGVRVATTLAVLLAALAPLPARAADVTLEGEQMQGGEIRSDASASGGAASWFSGVGGVDGIVTTPESSTTLLVRARGEECFGAPAIQVLVDGVPRLTTQIGTGGYEEIPARMSLPAGSHHVSIRMSNAHQALTCGRATLVDTVSIAGQPFSPSGWRNSRLSKRAPLAAHSRAMVAELRSQIRARGAWVGTSWYGTPVYTVGRDHPRVRVLGPPDRPDLQAQWDAVPLPPDARPGAGTDMPLALWQPSTDTYWEFWGLSRDLAGQWRARYGGRMERVSRNEGHFVDPPGPRFGASGSSIMLLAGMQRVEELRRGVIDHAVDFITLASRARDGWCWPAQRTDRPGGRSRADGAIPSGARFRFPASFRIKEYARDPRHPLSRYALTVALAVQRYGMVVRDVSSKTPGFVAEDPTPLGYDPYPELFEGQPPNSKGVLRNFPWKRLQVVAPPPGRGCTDDPDPDGR